MNRTRPQYSLRELLLGALIAGLGLAGLRLGGVIASLLIFAVIVFLVGVAIIAFVGRGEGQSTAIGCLIPVIAYTGCVVLIGNRELDPYQGSLPTTQLLRPVFQVFVQHRWVNLQTGEVLADDDPAIQSSGMGGGGFFPATPVGMSEAPDRASFMSLGHCLFAIVFGYVGASFARIVHRRRISPANF